MDKKKLKTSSHVKLENNCSKCIHCREGELNPQTLERSYQCTFNPPQVVVIPFQQGGSVGAQVSGVFPPVSKKISCSMFEISIYDKITNNLN